MRACEQGSRAARLRPSRQFNNVFFLSEIYKESHEDLGFRGEKGFVRRKLIQGTLYSVGGFLL